MKKLIINHKAQLKIEIAMKHMRTTEVQWLGRIKETKKGNYVLVDIFFPPQDGSGAFVTTRDDEFPTWFHETFIKKNRHKEIRLHGHTHPYFMTSPSGTDQQQFREFMQQVDDYMIQLILSNTYAPYCEIHYKDSESEKLKVVWDFTDRITKILQVTTKVPVGQQNFMDELFPEEIQYDAELIDNYLQMQWEYKMEEDDEPK